MASEIEVLLEERGQEYGPAWLLTADAMSAMAFRKSPLAATPFVFIWVIILNKLARALKSPSNMDHWRDIAGYAELAIRWAEEKNT